MHHYKEIIHGYGSTNISNSEMLEAIMCFHPVFDHVEEKNEDAFWEAMRGFHEKIKGCHFDEMYAKHEVNKMHHTKRNGTVCHGEIFPVDEAKRVYEKHVRNISNEINHWDVYVAINAQYHDYSKLYSEWFEGHTIEEFNNKIIISAINFWFKDEDAGYDKIWDYFKDVD